MSACPYCNTAYDGYRIVGVRAADAHWIGWLDEHVPIALLLCGSCGRLTFMHPDHPDVQRLSPDPPLEEVAQNIRTLNVALEEVGDQELRQQFEEGEGA